MWVKADGQALEKSKPPQMKQFYIPAERMLNTKNHHYRFTSFFSFQEGFQEGLAIILRKGVERQMLKWKPVRRRLIKIRMREKHVNITILQCYGPTNDNEDEVKDLLYEQLQAEVKIIPQHDMLVIMGDKLKSRKW